MRNARGFTLVETMAVIAFMGLALAGLAGMFANNNRATLLSHDLQRGTQLAQECGERVLEVRRTLSFTSTVIATTACDSLTAVPTGFTRTLTVSDPYTGTSTSTCPDNATCKDVEVTVTKGSAKSRLTLLLVSY